MEHTTAASQLWITCPEKYDSNTANLISKEVSEKVDPVAGVTLDFKETLQFDTLVLLRSIGVLGKFLRTKRKSFSAANASAEISTEIRLNGLDSTIRFISESVPPQAANKSKLNVEFVNPFISSTIKTLQTQCNMELKIGDKPFLKGSKPLPSVDIAGIIGLTSPAFKGSIAICFPKITFLGVMGGMLGEKFTDITDELQDGAGELLNIIFGQSKVIWNEKGFGVEKAIPTVIRAHEMNVRQYSNSPALILSFESAHGPFFIEIALE